MYKFQKRKKKQNKKRKSILYGTTENVFKLVPFYTIVLLRLTDHELGHLCSLNLWEVKNKTKEQHYFRYTRQCIIYYVHK